MRQNEAVRGNDTHAGAHHICATSFMPRSSAAPQETAHPAQRPALPAGRRMFRL